MTQRICLIRPPAIESFRFATTSVTPPLGLAYIAGALEQAGYHPMVLDAVALAPRTHRRYICGYMIGLAAEELAARIPEDTDLIGISAVFTHEWPSVVQLLQCIRARVPKALLVVGGEHVTSMPEFSLATSCADMLVLGEGEETMLAIAAQWGAGDADWSRMSGIAHRTETGIRVASRRPRRKDIDAIAWPAWHLFDLAQYHRFHYSGSMHRGRLSVPILATRGCPYQCTYCSAPNMWTPRWIPRDPVRVVDEIEYYVRTFGAGNFPFQDLTAIVQRDWILAFCRELIRRNLQITWQMPSGTRSEAVDAEVAALLAASGMVSMAYAPESGSDQTRQWIKKKMRREDLVQSVQAAAGAGLNVSMFLVIGFPHDTPQTLEENLPFAEEMARLGVNDMAVGFYMALPGTELFHHLYQKGALRIDRRYFTHILSANSLIPVASFNPALSRMDLFLWKLRIFRCFYLSSHHGRQRPLYRIASVVLGMLDLEHQTKLQSAMRNGLRSLWYSLAVRFKRRWMPVAQEQALFASWPDMYDRIQEQHRASGRWVSEVTEDIHLHRHNVIPTLKRVHGQEYHVDSVPLH